MNPPSLREICQAATPGPYSVVRCGHAKDEAMILGANKVRYVASVQIHQTPRACGLSDEPEREANAQLIARFSPETALAVYEALEIIQKSCGELRYSQRKKFSDDHFSIVVCDRVLANCKSVLALLDGRTEP